jgi:hypothetical protein
MRLTRGIKESLARAAFLLCLAGGAWLLLQFYSEEEIVSAGKRFWAWWSTIFTGELAPYWNPVGAGIVLAIALMFVLNPVTRLFRSRRHGGSYHDDGFHDYSGGDDGGD